MAETEFKKRQTAHKVSIGMITSPDSKVHFDENQRFRFLEVAGRDIYRINLIANIIDKFESNQKQYINITLDDGTGNIRVKAFADATHLLQNLQLGDSIIIIGVIRFYNDELYIMPEIIKNMDPKWLVARKMELEQEYGELYNKTKSYDNVGETYIEEAPKEIPQMQTQIQEPVQIQPKEEVSVEKISSGNEPTLREKIIESIRNNEAEGGIDIDKLIMSMKDPVDLINKEVTELLEEGSIYEPKPGRLRIL
jgi:RPA family protein